MSPKSAALPVPPVSELIDSTSRLMGGARVLRHKFANPLDVHDAIEAGLPGAALHHLVGKLTVLEQDAALEGAMGMSRRTLQRSRTAPERPLSSEQSGKAWKFAEVLALATDVLGSQDAAERWLSEPAIGLNQRRPIDLLPTPSGTELVETLLRRIDFGVYT